MSMNYQGDKLVTTSCKGTIVRVFSLPKGVKLYSFKRGVGNCMVYSLNFSKQGNHIVLSSENGTIHCFNLPVKDDDNDSENKDDDIDASDLSIVNSESKECSVFSVGSWFQACFPINYQELVASKKAELRLTSAEFTSPNIC